MKCRRCSYFDVYFYNVINGWPLSCKWFHPRYVNSFHARIFCVPFCRPFFLLVFVFKTSRNTIRVSTSLDPYQDQPGVELDLGPNPFQALSSADETGRKCVNA